MTLVRGRPGRDLQAGAPARPGAAPLLQGDRLIAATLRDVGGFRLREARDREEALEAAIEDRPEIVLLDYAMPRLDGVETCRRLRSDPVTLRLVDDLGAPGG